MPCSSTRIGSIAVALLLLLARPVCAQDGGAAEADSTAQNAHPSVDLPAALDRVLRDYERAWRAKDAAGLAALFAEDGFVLRSGHPPTRGREAIAAAYEGSGGRLHLRALAFDASGDAAYVIGGYTSTPKWPDAGTFILTLRKQPTGRWMITADMDNRNR